MIWDKMHRYILLKIQWSKEIWESCCLRTWNGRIKRRKAIISQLRNSFRCFDPKLITNKTTSVCEYAVPVWYPYLRKGIENLENIHHRASRLCPCISEKSYEERLKILWLTALETRRKRADLIQFYKALDRFDRIEWMSWKRLIEEWILKMGRGLHFYGKGPIFHKQSYPSLE